MRNLQLITLIKLYREIKYRENNDILKESEEMNEIVCKSNNLIYKIKLS